MAKPQPLEQMTAIMKQWALSHIVYVQQIEESTNAEQKMHCTIHAPQTNTLFYYEYS